MKSTESSFLPRVLLGAAAGAAVSLGASSASAAAVTLDPADVTIGQGASGTGSIYFDPQTGYVGSTQAEGTTGLNADFSLNYSFGSAAKPFIATYNGSGTQSGQTFLDANSDAPRFGINTGINAASATLGSSGSNYLMHDTGTTTTYPWNAGDHGFLGLAFTANAATGNGAVAGTTKLYGWAEVSYNSDQSLTLYRFGYDNAGGTSTTPASLAPGYVVPEPGSLTAAAVLGAAGLLAYRRRRAAAAGAREAAPVIADAPTA